MAPKQDLIRLNYLRKLGFQQPTTTTTSGGTMTTPMPRGDNSPAVVGLQQQQQQQQKKSRRVHFQEGVGGVTVHEIHSLKNCSQSTRTTLWYTLRELQESNERNAWEEQYGAYYLSDHHHRGHGVEGGAGTIVSIQDNENNGGLIAVHSLEQLRGLLRADASSSVAAVVTSSLLFYNNYYKGGQTTPHILPESREMAIRNACLRPPPMRRNGTFWPQYA